VKKSPAFTSKDSRPQPKRKKGRSVSEKGCTSTGLHYHNKGDSKKSKKKGKAGREARQEEKLDWAIPDKVERSKRSIWVKGRELKRIP